MSRKLFAVPVLIASALLAGCWATPVEQDRFGGDILVPDRSDEAMAEAEDIMSAHCGDTNWRIEGWDNVVVDVRETPHGFEDVVELHLYYSCLVPTSPIR